MTLFGLFNINVLTTMDGAITLDGKPVSGVKAILNTRIVFNKKNNFVDGTRPTWPFPF